MRDRVQRNLVPRQPASAAPLHVRRPKVVDRGETPGLTRDELRRPGRLLAGGFTAAMALLNDLESRGADVLSWPRLFAWPGLLAGPGACPGPRFLAGPPGARLVAWSG